MATRRKATPETPEETPQNGGGLSLAVRPSEGVKRASREPKDDATLQSVCDALSATLTEGAKAYDVATEDDTKKIVSLLQRAAARLGVGLRKSVAVTDDGWTVDFEASETKRQRKYTSKDIHAWYGENYRTETGPATIDGPIPQEVRDAFKVANKYATGTVELHGLTFHHE